MFKWDGSYLGEITDNNITAMTISKQIYWKVTIGLSETICAARPIKDFFPMIIDELKPIFSLPKLGTHSVCKKKQLYLLLRVPSTLTGEIQEELSLDELSLTYTDNILFTRQIQDILCFRDLLALSPSCESTIGVRCPHRGTPYPISIRENKMSFGTYKPIMSKHTLKKWFPHNDYNLVIQRMTGNIGGDITTTVANIRTQIEDTINRIDRDVIWCSVFIVDRLLKRLIECIN